MKIVVWFIIISIVGYASGYYRGHTSAIADDNEEKLQRMFDESEAVIGEMRTLAADAQAAVADARKAEQERNSEGEIRREKISQGMAKDNCARAVVPPAVSRGLLRSDGVSDKAGIPANAGRADGANPSPGADNAGNVGRGSYLGR